MKLKKYFVFILGIIISSVGCCFASSFVASDIRYNKNNVSNVSEAFLDLDSKVDKKLNYFYTSFDEITTSQPTNTEINLKKGKYLCYHTYYLAAGSNQSNVNKNVTNSISVSNCDELVIKDSRVWQRNSTGTVASGIYSVFISATINFSCTVNEDKNVVVSTSRHSTSALFSNNMALFCVEDM